MVVHLTLHKCFTWHLFFRGLLEEATPVPKSKYVARKVVPSLPQEGRIGVAQVEAVSRCHILADSKNHLYDHVLLACLFDHQTLVGLPRS
jgi:hypothetical protein